MVFFGKIQCFFEKTHAIRTPEKKTHICPWADPGLLAGRPGSAGEITWVAPPHFGRAPRAHPSRSLASPVWENLMRNFRLSTTYTPLAVIADSHSAKAESAISCAIGHTPALWVCVVALFLLEQMAYPLNA